MFVFGGRWRIRTADPLLVRQMLWTSWAKRPMSLVSKAMQRYGFFLNLQMFCGFFSEKCAFSMKNGLFTSWNQLWRAKFSLQWPKIIAETLYKAFSKASRTFLKRWRTFWKTSWCFDKNSLTNRLVRLDELINASRRILGLSMYMKLPCMWLSKSRTAK